MTRRITERALVVAMIAALAATIGAVTDARAEEDADDGWTHRSVRWKGAVTEGAPVEILNPLGNVYVRTADATSIEIIAHVQERGEARDRVRIGHEEDEEGTFVVRASATELHADDSRADVTVFVPKASPISIEIDDGKIEAKGIRTSLRARLRDGLVATKMACPVDFETDRAEIRHIALQSDSERPIRIRSESGPVRVTLDRDPNATIEIATHGRITTDYSIDVDSSHLPKKAKAVLGDGRDPVSIETVHGDVEIRRLFFERKAVP